MMTPSSKPEVEKVKNAYVLAKVGWQYNDEYYYRSDDDGVQPDRAFLSKTEADTECLKRNLAAFRSNDLRSYFSEYPPDQLEVSEEEFTRGTGREWNDSLDVWDWDDPMIPKHFTDDQVRAVMEMINIRFWEVVEVPLG